MNYYLEKENEYYTLIREDLIAEIPTNPNQKVLEVGAGGCDTLVALKKRGLASKVYAVELFEMPESNQQNPMIDELFIGDIEKELPSYPQNYFDVVLCGDVLEHLIDPWTTVRRLSGFLKQGGIMIVCCPNIRELFTWSKILINGTFRYDTSGIMDKTHLRFFCKKDLIDLLTTDNLKPIKAFPNYISRPRRKKYSFLHFGLLDPFFAHQNVVVSRKL